MPPAEEAQGVRIERLDSQGQEADAEVPPGPDGFGGDVLRIGFEKDPSVVLDGDVTAGGLQDPVEIPRLQGGRGPAAKVDRVDPGKG
jgi:hypothetical protein